MLARVFVLSCLALCLGTGCVYQRDPSSPSLSPESSVQAAYVLEGGCAGDDPAIETLARGLHALRGSEGWYAGRELAAAAKERDELVMHLLAREAVRDRCAQKTTEEAQRKLVWALMIAALLDGHDPFEWDSEVAATDLHLWPLWLPLGHRACSGHGLEGAGVCLVSGPFAVIADVVLMPIGSWFWSPEPARDPVSLRAFPPSPEVMRKAAQARELGVRARAMGIQTPTSRVSLEAPSPLPQ